MTQPDSIIYFPNKDPRSFLAEQVTAQREQAEVFEPGGPHRGVAIFEDYCQRFIGGTMPAETLCLYSMLTYAQNREKLEGTKAGELIASFPENFSRYVYISQADLVDLREDAEIETAITQRN